MHELVNFCFVGKLVCCLDESACGFEPVAAAQRFNLEIDSCPATLGA